MGDLDIPKIASELSNDPVTVKNWRKFYDVLGLSPGEVVVLTNRYNVGLITSYELFSHILNSWQSENGREATIEKLEIIKKSVNEEVETVATQKEIKFTPLKFPLKHNYLGVVAKYVTRPYLEKQIVEGLTNRENRGRLHFPIVVLHGIGGVGKTSLARKICQMTTQRSFFSSPILGGNCVWINSETEELIIRDFSKLFGFEVKSKDNVLATLQKTYPSQFETNQCLFVFDNVNDYKMVTCYLPLTLESKISVLITSNEDWPLKELGEVKNIPVEKFTTEELSEFVRKILPNISQAENQSIEEYTGRIPYLANLVCFGLTKWKLTFPDKDIKEYFEFVREENTYLKQEFIDYQNSPEKIVKRQMELIEKYYGTECTANKLLCLLAYCDSDIDFQRLVRLALNHFHLKYDANSINSGIDILINQGFLEKKTALIKPSFLLLMLFKNFKFFTIISIHRSYQEAVRKILEQQGKELNQIEQLLTLEEYRFLLNRSLLWELGKKYGVSMLIKMINSPFMFNTFKDHLQDLIEFVRKTKPSQEFSRFINLEMGTNFRNNIGNNLLFCALMWDNLEVVEILLNAGADPNCKYKYSFTPLHIEVGFNNIVRVKTLLSYKADPNMVDDFGWTPLHYAVHGRSRGIWWKMLRHIKFSSYTVEDGSKELWRAMFENALSYSLKYEIRVEMVSLLLSHGADITIKNKEDKTALEIAERQNPVNKEMVYLIRTSKYKKKKKKFSNIY